MMRGVLVTALLLIGLGSAFAEQAPKSVKTETIRTTAPGFETLYSVDEATGEVRIDWQMAEDLAVTKADRIALPIAQLMLAIRDGKWKAMH